MNQEFNNFNQDNLNRNENNMQENNQQSTQIESIDLHAQNSYSSSHKPKREKSELIFGVFIVIVIAIIIIIKSLLSNSDTSSGSDKLVCKSDTGSLTILYNKNDLVDCKSDGINYKNDIDYQREEANKIGVENYIIAMYSWFVDTQKGSCTVEGKSKNRILSSPLIEKLHTTYQNARKDAAIRSAELVYTGIEYACTSYMYQNNGNVATKVSDLKPYFNLDNFEMNDQGIIVEKEWSGSTNISCEITMTAEGVQVACPNVEGYNTKTVKLR